MTGNRGRLFCLLACAALAFPGAARAADDATTLEIGLYVWGAGLYGHIDTDEGKVSNNVAFSDLIENLNLALMGRARLDSGKLSLVGDVEYLDLESERERRTIRLGPEGGIHVPASAKAEMKSWVAELSGGYELFDLDEVALSPSTELYLGVRYWSMSPDVDVDVGTLEFDMDETLDWFDGIVGMRWFFELSPTVLFTVQGDVGGFGIGSASEFAWSQMTSLSWAFSERWQLHLAYKFMEFRHEGGGADLKEQFRGPVIATSVRF